MAGTLATILMLVTPRVTDAPARVRAFAAAHHETLPIPTPPPRFNAALVATEDHRFYSAIDIGVDPFAVARFVGAYLALDKQDIGGSSLDQQLAKMLYTPGRTGQFMVEMEQVALALKIHFSYSHTEILRMYSAVAYFGGGYYGLNAASRGYFGREPVDLSWIQAATLAGVVNAPSRDDPRTHLTRALARCHHVFRRLVAVGYLSRTKATAAIHEPLGLTQGGT